MSGFPQKGENKHGVDIHIFIAKLNHEENKYEYVQLYRKNKDKNKFEEIYVFEGRNHELFSILRNEQDDNFPSSCINESSLPIEIKEKLDDWKECGYGFNEVNLADLKLYLIKHPTIPDYDAEDWTDESECPKKDSPLKWFIKDIETYIEFYDWTYGWNSHASDIKLIYWFDC